MKVQDSSIAMSTASTYYRRHEETLKIEISGNNRPNNTPNLMLAARLDVAEFSAQSLSVSSKTSKNDELDYISNADSIKILILEKMLGVVFNREFKTFSNDEKTQQLDLSTNPTNQSAPFQVTVTYHEVFEESETMGFRAQGTISTDKGNIAFDFELSYQRYHYEERFMRMVSGQPEPIDPLVVNLSGNLSLGAETFKFDLNMDGNLNDIPVFSSNSWLLALDKNKNGVIDDGSELFGPATGDGFLELSKYDEDGNGFIDKNDSVFGDLRLMRVDSSGNRSLMSLIDANIGAIYVNKLKTPFTMTNANNTAIIKDTSIYVKESGSVGSIHNLDFKV